MGFQVFLWSTLLAIFVLLIIPVHTWTMAKEIRNVVVIGWDGADRSRAKELLEKGELPKLAALIQEGKLLDIDVVTGATDTKAGWTQLLTGCVPEKAGVYSNCRYEPIPEGYTVFERLETFFGRDQIDTVAIIHFSEPDHRGHAFGENSYEYADGFKLNDRHSSMIIDRLKTLGLYEKILIYVISDHGFDKGKNPPLFTFRLCGNQRPHGCPHRWNPRGYRPDHSEVIRY